MGLGLAGVDGRGGRVKVAFCFPGQGSLEQGMGREIAEAVPEAMEVFDLASEASGLDLRRLCFDGPLEDLVETEVQQPALVKSLWNSHSGSPVARDIAWSLGPHG